MSHPSFAPSAAHDYSDDLLDSLAAPRSVKSRARLSLVPPPAAEAAAAIMPVLEEAFRKLNTMPPGAASNDGDALTEDELFAIWTAHLC